MTGNRGRLFAVPLAVGLVLACRGAPTTSPTGQANAPSQKEPSDLDKVLTRVAPPSGPESINVGDECATAPPTLRRRVQAAQKDGEWPPPPSESILGDTAGFSVRVRTGWVNVLGGDIPVLEVWREAEGPWWAVVRLRGAIHCWPLDTTRAERTLQLVKSNWPLAQEGDPFTRDGAAFQIAVWEGNDQRDTYVDAKTCERSEGRAVETLAAIERLWVDQAFRLELCKLQD